MKVAKIEKIEYRGNVHNLEVADNHNYFANGNCVSNCHLSDGKSLTQIMVNCRNARYRIGTTGTLKNIKVSEIVLEGLFGEVRTVARTRQLMDAGTVAALDLKCLILQYPEEDCKIVHNMEYDQEVDYICAHPTRLKFVRNLALSLKGNTLLLFALVQKGAIPVHDAIQERLTGGRQLFFVDGDVNVDDRESIRFETEGLTDAIIIATYQTFGVGINIQNIDNIILVSGGKSKVRLLQAIGRGLRTSDRKKKLTVHDLIDDLRFRKRKNYSVLHFSERLAIYAEEELVPRMYRISLA